MRNDPKDPSQRDASTGRDADADLTDQFWGKSPDWTGEQRRPRDPLTGGRGPRPTLSNTGIVAAIRDGMSAFKPQLRDASGPIERTRTHGVVRPDSPRPDDAYDDTAPLARPRRIPLAASESSIADLAAGGESDHEFAPHPWERRGGGNRRATSSDDTTAAIRLDQTGPIEFFDQEVDEVVEPSRDGFAAYADMEFESVRSDSWLERFAAVGPSRSVAVALLVTTVLAVPYLLSRGDDAVTPAEAGAIATAETPAPTVPGATTLPGVVDPATPVTAQSDGSPVPTTAAGAGDVAATPTDESTTVADTEVNATPEVVTTVAATQPPSNDATPATPTTEAPATTGAPATAAPTTAAATTAAPTTTQPACALHYTAGAGDSWYRIADEAGVSLKSVLAVNNATIDSLILPGDDICLPAGATKPSPPTTAAPTTAPATTTPTSSAPTTTVPETTTTAPPATTTTVPSGSPGRNASPAEVQQIIRDVFPDEIEEKALDIARKESRYSPTAYNGWCCHGVFQIYYTVHAGWLSQFGVNKAEDLYDPLVNAKVALEIYRRAGNSFSPWTTA